MIQSRKVNTGIGVGDAQILQGNDNSDDFGRLGAAAGYNSDGAKLRRVKSKANELTSDLDYKKDGWTMFQHENFNAATQQAVEKIRSAEFQKSPNWEAEAQQMLSGLNNMADINTSTAKLANNVSNSFRKEDRAMLSGIDDLELMYGKYEIPESEDPLESLKEYNALMEVNASNVKKEFEHDYDIGDYETTTKKYTSDTKNGRQFSSSKEVLTDKGRAAMQTDARNQIVSGLKQISGATNVIKRPEDITFANDVIEYAEGKYASKINGFETEEEKNKFLTEVVAAEFLESKILLNSETGSKPVKPEKGSFSDKELNVARDVKSLVNRFQDNKDEEPINQFLAPYGLIAEVKGDSVKFYKNKFNSDGEKVKSFETGDISIQDAEAMYNVIAKNNSFLKRGAIDEVEFNDPTPNNPDYSQEEYKAVDGIIDNMFKGYDNDTEDEAKKIAKQFGDDVEYIDNMGGDEIKIGEDQYDLTKEDQAKEAFDILQKRGLEKGLGRSAKKSTTIEGYTSSEVEEAAKASNMTVAEYVEWFNSQ